jgi:hypothetical protein
MVKYLKKLYDKVFKSREDIEHIKKVEFYNRNSRKTKPTITNHQPNHSN